jgi:hypothetical protein
MVELKLSLDQLGLRDMQHKQEQLLLLQKFRLDAAYLLLLQREHIPFFDNDNNQFTMTLDLPCLDNHSVYW